MYHQSDMMRSLRMLVGNGGGGSVVLKTNNNAVLTDSNGMLDINSIKLNMPNGVNGSSGVPPGTSGQLGHKRGLSIMSRPTTQEEARKQTLLKSNPHNDEEAPKNNLNVEDFENN
jgi:hypothetical protein